MKEAIMRVAKFVFLILAIFTLGQTVSPQTVETFRIVGKPAFFSRTMKINIGSENKFFAGFWLYETGCHPVELTARVVGQKQRMRKTINLRCGE
jgi:hypothetical protein